MRILKHLLVYRRLADHARTLPKHAMAKREVAALHVAIRHRDYVVAEQGANPANRPHKAHMLRSPSLTAVVWPLKTGDYCLAKMRENGHGWLWRNILFCKDVLFPVRIIMPDKAIWLDAIFASETTGGLSGIAVAVKGDARRRPTFRFVPLARTGPNAKNQHGKTARRGDHAQLAMRDPRLSKARSYELAKLLSCVDKRRRRHLFAADLQKEVLCLDHLCHLPPLAGIPLVAGHLREVCLTALLCERPHTQDVICTLDS